MKGILRVLTFGVLLFGQIGIAQAVDCNEDGVINGLDVLGIGCPPPVDPITCGEGTVQIGSVCVRVPDDTVESVEFAYSSDIGPGFWGELTPDWEACLMDTRQSPLNVTNAQEDAALGALALSLQETPLRIFNNGHTIQQEYEAGSTLTFNGLVYELLQFHFHTLSENVIEGQRGTMELHAVFRNAETGTLAVIGLLYHIGAENDFLAHFDATLPAMEGDVIEAETEINLSEAFENTSDYYTFDGSLTTPPCSPIVTWIVLAETAEMSSEQLGAFQGILGNNFRPLQELNDRVIRRTPISEYVDSNFFSHD